MRTKTFIGIVVILMAFVGVTAYGNESNANPAESLYGEWWLVGWNDKGTWSEVDTNYVSHKHLSIEIPKEGVAVAYSMVNEIMLGELAVKGNEMIFSGEMRGSSTKVYCNIAENLFFEDHIGEIKSHQLDGDLLRLYYTDDDYYVFTKDFDDSEEYGYEWKKGPIDPFIGEVTSLDDGTAEVKIIHSPSYVVFYSRTMPPVGNHEVGRFVASDIAGQSLEVGDKVAFRIVEFKRLKVENGREYQLKVEPCKGSERIANRVGTMHNDQRMGWIIIDDAMNDKHGGIYYYPLTLAEKFLAEGMSVVFSGELYTTSMMSWDNKGNPDCYYLDIDVIESLQHTPVRSITPAKVEEPSEIYDLLGRRQTSKQVSGIYIKNGKKVIVK